MLKPAKAARPGASSPGSRELAPDCCPVVAYGALVPRAALDIPKHGWVNLHFSLLPAWRGAAPVQHAVWHGDDVTGASTFLLEEGLDTGPVFGVVTETIRPDRHQRRPARPARRRAARVCSSRRWTRIEEGILAAAPQPADGVSLAPKITVEDAEVDWSQPAVRVDRLVRACTPAPGAWTTFRGERLKLGPVAPLGDDTSLAPGELAVDKNRVRVGTASARRRARRGPRAGPEADGRRRLGPRRPPRARVEAGRMRSPGTRTLR